MKIKLFGTNIEPSCEYCKFSKIGNNNLLCRKKGIIGVEKPCKRFLYEPLKRKPVKITLNPNFSKEDFEL